MLLSELEKHVNESIKLRSPNKGKTEEYAERMEAGVTFPPIVIGHWPKSEKYGESGIVDGIHRLIAATLAKRTEFPTETKKFQSLEEALVYAYTANMAHGLPVTESQRNSRIQLLRKIDPKLTLEKIGKQFGLGKSSVDRIIKGDQGEGKPGPKGASKSTGQKTAEPKKASGLYKLMTTLNEEFQRKRPNQLVEMRAYLTPSTKEHPDGEVDKERCATIAELTHYLTILLKDL